VNISSGKRTAALSRYTKNAAHGGKALGGILVWNQVFGLTQFLEPGKEFRTRAKSARKKGAAGGGTVLAYCAGQPGSLTGFRHSDVTL
jgi:hypothetical protein